MYLDEKNSKLTEIYQQKMISYLDRAEYIKKTCFNTTESSQGGNGGGSGASAQARK